MDDEAGYLLANRQAEAGRRFAALSALFDAATERHLRALGVGPGFRCWEVGAGGMTIPDWLAAQVGPTGTVIATDIDPAWLTPRAAPAVETADSPGRGGPLARRGRTGMSNSPGSGGPLAGGGPVRVLRHDVGTEEPPERDLDLVHARLVLTHVPQRDAALAAMVAALRPGGRLLLEEADPGLQPLLCPEDRGPEQQLANRLRRGFRSLMAGRAADLAYGRTLPRLLREQGLADVGAEAFFPITAPACVDLELATVEQIRDRLVDAGIATPEEIDRHADNVASGRLPELATAPMISAWGRKP